MTQRGMKWTRREHRLPCDTDSSSGRGVLALPAQSGGPRGEGSRDEPSAISVAQPLVPPPFVVDRSGRLGNAFGSLRLRRLHLPAGWRAEGRARGGRGGDAARPAARPAARLGARVVLALSTKQSSVLKPREPDNSMNQIHAGVSCPLSREQSLVPKAQFKVPWLDTSSSPWNSNFAEIRYNK